MARILLIGTAYPFRGGLAAFNERMARAFQQAGHEVMIYTFTVQYPSFLFPGKTQFADGPPPADLQIQRKVHALNPLNWIRVGMHLKRLSPDLIIVKYWLPFMAPCFGTLLRLARLNKHSRIVCVLDNVIPHEQHFLDTVLTQYFLQPVDAFIAMSQQVWNDLRRFTNKPARLVPHPVYDVYGKPVSRDEACQKLGLDSNLRYVLFFGFIRAYKGLDLLLEAFADPRIREKPELRLIVAGEFYENREKYLQLIDAGKLHDRVILRNDFIPDEEVKYYFCAADVVVQPYRSATQSGISQIAYHFGKPMIVTRVGGLPEIVPHGQAGLVCDPHAHALAEAIAQFFSMDISSIVQFVQMEKKRFSWEYFTEAILSLAGINEPDEVQQVKQV
ncbi:MAG: glycosyltransferase [Thermoflavifilum sp.]|nr:glycosyltransferase [Thermoflavifilum sp.]